MRILSILSIFVTTAAFTPINSKQLSQKRASSSRRVSNDWEVEAPFERSNLDKFLSTKYPAFYTLLSLDDDILKLLQESTSITVFCPVQKVFDGLDSKRLAQLADPRNLETVQKIVAYHIIPDEVIPATRLFQEDWTVPKTKSGKPELSFRGVMTMGGEVAVGRSKPVGFLGLLKEEDDQVTIGPEAKILKSFVVGKYAIVHEVSAFVSPVLLWRFMDQLRIPGF
jgi:uncharacterized surface protein with fasciclin (FAS1) repeats